MGQHCRNKNLTRLFAPQTTMTQIISVYTYLLISDIYRCTRSLELLTVITKS